MTDRSEDKAKDKPVKQTRYLSKEKVKKELIQKLLEGMDKTDEPEAKMEMARLIVSIAGIVGPINGPKELNKASKLLGIEV